ncbi:hypothetical protein GCM10023082_56570 [Streptomyces tremellae]|uniref:Uncharacterized protein n=1 Tax=Streptomyces tremellae TaxID=1124239 RepID=A0ABP7G7H5_9ACTN
MATFHRTLPAQVPGAHGLEFLAYPRESPRPAAGRTGGRVRPARLPACRAGRAPAGRAARPPRPGRTGRRAATPEPHGRRRGSGAGAPAARTPRGEGGAVRAGPGGTAPAVAT